jgi:glutathione synthase/RimK-type ligase-like ATP-grasp enzyme
MRPDWPLLRQALAEVGVAASTRVWTYPDVPWHEFDLVLANGAWDNIHRPAEFLAWVAAVGETTPMVNSPDVLRWNLDKRYLAALSDAGVATVPTTWLTPDGAFDEGGPDLGLPPGTGEFVVKPTISGGGFETARYRAGDAQAGQAARAHIRRLLDAGRAVMVQPYQTAVDAHGEAGLIFFGGRYSHAIGKGPLLRVAAGPQSRLWEHEEIGALTPTETQLEAAHRALAAAEHLVGPTTYARVDLVSTADGTPAVLELELLDPAFFFETQPSAATRFAQVLRDCIP